LQFLHFSLDNRQIMTYHRFGERFMGYRGALALP